MCLAMLVNNENLLPGYAEDEIRGGCLHVSEGGLAAWDYFIVRQIFI